MLTGEYRNSLDEKGRLLIPSRLRSALSGASLIITRGIDHCLWLFLPDVWKNLVVSMIRAASPLQKTARMLQRRVIAPAQEIELDKSGRINVPATLAEYAHLNKDCLILGIDKYLELWNWEEYQKYIKETEDQFHEAAEELGGLVSFFDA